MGEDQQVVIWTVEELRREVLERHPSDKLLEAGLEEKHGVYIYEVEVVDTDGVVRELDREAAAGSRASEKSSW
ncbi:hypothetical protein B1218_35005 [Pseudomonas ogarae]|nr:hypothetical protein B1218_35005 [Pseudomonas ogarae]